MFLSGMLGCEGRDEGEGGEMHLWLEHAQVRPLPLKERKEGEEFLPDGPADSSAS